MCSAVMGGFRQEGDTDMGLLGGGKYIIGYDMGSGYAQVSFSASGDGNVETLSQVAGEEKYNIPMALCKKYGSNQWFYGREALRCAAEDQGVLVENLLPLAIDGEPVIVEGESYDPVALLALFFKRSLGNLKIAAIMITCPTLDHRTVEVLEQASGSLSLKRDKIFFQGYGESYYSYLLRQPEELWLHQSVLFEYRNDSIKAYRLECNRRTRPIVVFIQEEEYDFYEYASGSGELWEEMDAVFYRIADGICSGRPVGSVFLIGDGFSENWMKNSLRLLCKGRRVFQGNNLFSKGACCGMQERFSQGEAGKNHVFLGKDKLKANVGMKVLRQGEETYYALLDAGVNWYEAEQKTELYIQEGNELELLITPLIKKSSQGDGELSGNTVRNVKFVLEGLPEAAARIRLRLFPESENSLTVEAEDMGFGQFRAPSGRVWKKVIDL